MTVRINNTLGVGLVLLGIALAASPAFSQQPTDTDSSGQQRTSTSDAEIAKQLQNPLANLISVPFQSNFDFGGGPNDDGFRYLLNLQPVVPFELNEDWNLITRTIIPIASQQDLVTDGSQSGLGDIAQTFYFSPTKPGSLIWGVGPVLLYPTATDNLLGSEKWGAGPSAVLLKQENGWTKWILANHIWSFAGDGNRDDVNLTYANPGIAYQTKSLTTYVLQAEPVYDWKHEQWTVPVMAGVTQLIKFGGLPVQIGLQLRYYAEKPDGGPDWGLRIPITFVFPK
jgi:hypothetical protein